MKSYHNVTNMYFDTAQLKHFKVDSLMSKVIEDDFARKITCQLIGIKFPVQ